MMLFACARFCLILSLVSHFPTQFQVHAFPELLGLGQPNRRLNERGEPLQFATEEHVEEERKLRKRQLEVLGGLLDTLAPGSFDAVLSGSGGGSGGGGWSGFGSIEVGFGPFDVWVKYPYEQPGLFDQRGPCPGLNSLANHHVINHSGVVNIFEVLDAAMSVYNLGFDLSLISVLLAVVFGGDPVTLTFSIGDMDKRVGAPLGGLLGLLGTPQGLRHTHNSFEGDSSLTRQDLYMTGNAWTMDVDLFFQLYTAVPYGTVFTREAFVQASCLRWHQSEQWNTWFWYGPGTGYIRSFAQMGMLYLFSNHSDGSLDGYLTPELLYSFLGMSDYPVPFTMIEGGERIPENWWPRPVPFDAFGHLAEFLKWIEICPALGSIGGNTGAPNSFVGINLEDPASGLTNIPNLLEGNNLLCFMLQIVKTGSPSFLNNIYATIFGLVGQVATTLGCPVIPDLTRGGVPLFANLQATYPGAQIAEPPCCA